MVKVALALLLAAALASPAAAQPNCNGFDLGDPRASFQESGVPHQPYPGDALGDAPGLFRILAQVVPFDGKISTECELAGQVAYTRVDDRTVRVCPWLESIVGSKDELAFVIGHEIGHIVLGHRPGDVRPKRAELEARWRAELGTTSNGDDSAAVSSYREKVCRPLMEFLRVRELQADDFGFDLVAKAGFDRWAAARAMGRIHDDMMGETDIAHPPPKVRIEKLDARAEDLARQLGTGH